MKLYLEHNLSRPNTTKPAVSIAISWWNYEKIWFWIINISVINIRLNSSRPPFLLQKCLPPNTTVIGRPFLSDPCMNILFCAISFWTSDTQIEPSGANVFLHFTYFRNMAHALSMSRSRARRNLLIVRSSYSWIAIEVFKKSLICIQSWRLLTFSFRTLFNFWTVRMRVNDIEVVKVMDFSHWKVGSWVLLFSDIMGTLTMHHVMEEYIILII